jgi:hypothetical protein
MPRPRPLTLLLVALVLQASASAQVEPSGAVKATGIGTDREAAEKAALAKAVSAFIETLADAPTRKKHQAEVEKSILPKAAELVKSHEVLRTDKQLGGKLAVQVRAVVDRQAVQKELVEAGVLDRAAVAGDEVVRFCRDNLGKKVGDGECATLAQEALKGINAKPFFEFKEDPGMSDYVWGELVFVEEFASGKRRRTPADGKPRAGDVVQYRNAKFRGPRLTFTYPHHTSVVAEAKPNGDLVVFEQNMNGKKEVMQSTVRPAELAEGWIRVYRPVLK